MQTVTDQISVAANSTDQNVLQTNGNRIRTVAQSIAVARVTLYSTASATGLQESFFAGSQNPVENSRVSLQNRIPIVPDDVVATDIYVRGGEQLQLQVANTTAGALTYFYRIDIEELTASEIAALAS